MLNSISSNGIKSMTYVRIDKSNDAQIKLLRQQEITIQKQIDSIKNSKQDPKTKQELIKPLESQIQSIEEQIQQAQVDQVSNKNDNSNSSSKINLESNERLQKDNIFLSMSNTYKQVKEINSVRKNFEGRANELKADAASDEMRLNFQMAERERSEASKDQGKANGLQSKVGKLNRDMNKSVKNEINKENKIENIRVSDSDKDIEKSPGKILKMDFKSNIQNNSGSNKKQLIDTLV